ncbi:hypothetical protein C8Q76DRAFT_598694, partial [Earliella scabrosa]
QTWYATFRIDVDSIIFISNRHDMEHGKRCLRGNPTYCRVRFLRDVFEHTMIDMSTGAIHLKHVEPWINTFNIVISGALWCNTDLTCLQSGTSV